MATTSKIMQRARDYREAGLLAEAKIAYGQILATEPKQHQALHELAKIEFADQSQPLGIRYLDHLTVVQGGVAVSSVSGQHLGGFGVSGAPAEHDEACGLAGVKNMLASNK